MNINTDTTYLIYDKTCSKGPNTYDNTYTVTMCIDEIMSNDIYYVNDEAILMSNDLKSFREPFCIPNNLDYTLYTIYFFVIPINEPINSTIYITVIGINNNRLSEIVTNNGVVPNNDFFNNLCFFNKQYTSAYHRFNKNVNNIIKNNNNNDNDDDNDDINIDGVDNIEATIKEITDKIMSNINHLNDPIIDDLPFNLMVQLFNYQKRSIKWMLDKEKNLTNIKFNINCETQFDQLYYDINLRQFKKYDERFSITFYGGCVTDEVGLGKTVQIIALSLLNKPCIKTYTDQQITKYQYLSKATLILCPNQLCGQWKREFEKMLGPKLNIKIIMLLTKVHYNKLTYAELCDADFVIVSYSFLDNRIFLDNWISTISSVKSYHHNSPTYFDSKKAMTILNNQGISMLSKKDGLTQKDPNILLIYWNRIVVDEIHEIYTVSKHFHMQNILPLFKGNYSWAMSGTPFDKSPDCLVNIVDYITHYTNICGEDLYFNDSIISYLSNDCFRRNTKQGVLTEFELAPVEEKIIWLKFTATERMMYNAYLADQNNDKYSVFLRQLCCHPKLSQEIKSTLVNCKTLADIEKTMLAHYKTRMDDSKKKYDSLLQKIKILTKKIADFDKSKQKSKNDDNDLNINDNDFNINDLEFDLVPNNDNIDNSIDKKKIKKDIYDIANNNIKDNTNSIKIKNNSENKDEILKLILAENGSDLNKIVINLESLKNSLQLSENKIHIFKKDFDCKKTTYEFYFNVIERIRKTSLNKKKDDCDNDNNNNNDDDEPCAVCMDQIPEDNIGVTKCGHIFCHDCLNIVVTKDHKCPYCRTALGSTDIFMISYEKKKTISNNKHEMDKEALINTIGTKLANVICYLQSNDEHIIIFSQWDDLLSNVGHILSDHNIKNVFCRGSVYQRDKAIRDFNNNDDIRVIMLSSQSSASGINLTKATTVIMLDPVSGTFEFRKNTEGQAIGRTHRLGQTKPVTVVRFIIKDTIEEEIYDSNKKIDIVKNANMKIYELTEESITLKKPITKPNNNDDDDDDNDNDDNGDDGEPVPVINVPPPKVLKRRIIKGIN